MKHTGLLDAAEKNYRQRFATVRRESQNSFRCRGQSGAILAGKPDLVGVSETELRIVDVKTGSPSDEHWVQMLLYMKFFPMCFPHLSDGLAVTGELRYPDGVQEVYLEEYEVVRERVMNLLSLIVSPEPPPKIASSTECSHCIITTADCEERVEEAPESEQFDLAEF
jgi:hypothetical protein